ncbi:hypothetical protein [Actinoplanes subglobosus]|uniref:Uncharacterized protein n=1 Tax=Actinoplanes subglobosus TaxID=1547892 RepID=A0ABV8IS57_9ACTN
MAKFLAGQEINAEPVSSTTTTTTTTTVGAIQIRYVYADGSVAIATEQNRSERHRRGPGEGREEEGRHPLDHRLQQPRRQVRDVHLHQLQDRWMIMSVRTGAVSKRVSEPVRAGRRDQCR